MISSARIRRQLTLLTPVRFAWARAAAIMPVLASMPRAAANNGASRRVSEPGPHPTSSSRPVPSSPRAPARTSRSSAGYGIRPAR